MNPEILIVDEALSVGDASFAEKCMARMRHFRAEGKTIFFVTHAPWQMLNFCDRVMWLHQGRVVGYDTAERMIPAYVAFTREWTQLDHLQRTQLAPDYETYRAQVEISSAPCGSSAQRKRRKNRRKQEKLSCDSTF